MNRPINNSKLREILKNYLSSKNPGRPLAILSKPFSGRTSTLESVAEELNVSNRDIFNMHVFDCPRTYSKTTDFGELKNVNFDQWLDYELRNQKLLKYNVLEIDPNEFMTVRYDDLWGDGFFTSYREMGEKMLQFLSSEKYELIAYYPDFNEWMAWAESQLSLEKYRSDMELAIEFANKYPEFYDLTTYNVYDQIALNFWAMSSKLNREEESSFDLKMLPVNSHCPWSIISLLHKALRGFCKEHNIECKE